MKEIKGRRILVLGYGREGRSVASYMRRVRPNLEIEIADRDKNAVAGADFKSHTGENYAQNIDTFDTVVRSPGIPASSLKTTPKTHVTSATNIFLSEVKGAVIGVTGTKGKSTTTSLIYQIVRHSGRDARLVGNIGYPALDALPDSTPETVFVLELSSYQLSDIRYSPNIAVVLPVFPEHLNYHGNFDTYVQAKANIVRYQKPQDTVIYAGFNRSARTIADISVARKLSYDSPKSDPGVWAEAGALNIRQNGQTAQLFQLDALKLLGQANAQNICAAGLMALCLDIDPSHIKAAAVSFEPLEHRLEAVGTFGGITFYNDSLSTIPEAAIHALEALGDRVHTLIAGGLDRGVDYTKLGQAIVGSSIGCLILFPTTGEKIVRAVKAAGKTDIETEFVEDMSEAVRKAYVVTPSGKICLLSPASASYNMFRNYADRGNQFKKSVREYKETENNLKK